MIFSRKQPPALEPMEEEPPKPLPDHNVELRAYWDDKAGDWQYDLSKLFPRRSGEIAPGNWRWWPISLSYDRAWADRQAEHYGIEIIYPDKEEQS